jgi:hypothetical protein
MSFLKTYLKVLSILLVITFTIAILLFLGITNHPIIFFFGVVAIAAIPVAMVETK